MVHCKKTLHRDKGEQIMSVGFFAVFDDIASLLDDAATMSKIATKQTVGILGDDLAVNAQKASDFSASRELPVLWAITKGSLRNKFIILPIAFLLSAFAPWAIIPILMIGGVYLAFEGAEKVFEYFFHHKQTDIKSLQSEIRREDILKIEAKKIKSAILTDFILSIEIVIMALGTVLGHPLLVQIFVVTLVAILATIGVYGVVALLVRMDDLGIALVKREANRDSLLKKTGKLLITALPQVIRLLTFVGTLAMFLVAGGIFVHNIEQLHHILEFLPLMVGELLVGLVVGAVALLLHQFYLKIIG